MRDTPIWRQVSILVPGSVGSLAFYKFAINFNVYKCFLARPGLGEWYIIEGTNICLMNITSNTSVLREGLC